MVLSKKILILVPLFSLLYAHAGDERGWITVGNKKRKKTVPGLVNSDTISSIPDHIKIKHPKIDPMSVSKELNVLSISSQTPAPKKKIPNKVIPLHFAVYHDDIPKLKSLIKSGEDVSALDQNYATALHWAACNGKTLAANILLTQADGIACLGMQDIEGKTPLHRAAGIKSDVILTLVNAAPREFIDIRDKDGSTALLWAANAGKLAAVKILLKKGANPNVQDNDRKRTALHWTLRMRTGSIAKDGYQMPAKTSQAIIKNLMDHNANPYIHDAEGFSPIYWAQQLSLGKELSMLNKDQPLRRSARNKHKK